MRRSSTASFANVEGAHAIYLPTARGFRTYVSGTAATLARARAEGGQVDFMAFAQDSSACHRRTLPTDWQHDNICHVHVDVDTSACGFPAGSTPHYFTSLRGTTLHGPVRGATSIVSPTATSFRVDLYGNALTAALAKGQNWQLEWVASP